MSKYPAFAVSEAKPVRVLAAVAAMCVAAPSALAVIPGVPGWVAAAVGAVGALILVGLGTYTEGQVVPDEDVLVKQTPSGQAVAGTALEGVPNGATVTSIKTEAGEQLDGFLDDESAPMSDPEGPWV